MSKSFNKFRQLMSTILSETSGDETSFLERLEEQKEDIVKLFKSGKSSRKKDPSAPKKSKTSYIIFCGDYRNQIKSENPNFTTTEITSKIASLWKAISPSEKLKYEARAKEDKERYEEDMKRYTPSEEFESVKKKKSGPKRPLSAYLYFCAENRDVIKKEIPSLSAKEITSELGKRWKSLTADEKAPFLELQAEDKARYVEEKENSTETKKPAAKPKKEAPKKEVAKPPAKAKAQPKKEVAKTAAKTTVKPTPVVPVPVKEEKKKAPTASVTLKSTPGFVLFEREQRETISSEHPEWSAKKLKTEIAARWNDCEDKEDYENAAVADDEELSE